MLFLRLQIGNDRYALEARHVVEVISFVPLKRMPGAPRGVAGLFNYRGTPLPAVDLCELMLNHPARERLSTRIIVVSVDDANAVTRWVGLIAEQVTSLIRGEPTQTTDAGIPTKRPPYLGGVILDGQGMVQLLQPERLLDLGLQPLLPHAPEALTNEAH